MPEYPITAQSAYFANIAKIINYFRHTKGSGFLFCACNSQALVQEINRQILEKAKAIGLNIAEVYLTSEHTEDSLDPIRAAAEQKPDGIILNNLNELVMRSNGAFVREINFAREILIDMEVPLLFWLSEENMSRFANDAADLFSRKDRGIVHFTALSGVTAMDRFQDNYFEQYRQTEDYSSLKLKIELLEKQLKEAEEKKYSPKRIANEIVEDLIDLYVKAYLRDEAWALFEKYGEYLDENPKNLEIIAELHYRSGKWDNAFEYLIKSEKIRLGMNDFLGLGKIYNDIGFIFFNKGDLDRSYYYFQKAIPINSKTGNQSRLSATYDGIGLINLAKGNLNQSLEYFLKSEKIRIETGDIKGLGWNYYDIGLIYLKKKEWDNALEYFIKSGHMNTKSGHFWGLGFSYKNIGLVYSKKGDRDKALEYSKKSEKIFLEIGHYAGLGYVYYNIGLIYSDMENWDKALEYYIKSEQICLEAGDRAAFAFTYFEIGRYYLQKNDKEKATPYLILAGYIAKTVGMKHELSEWSDLLNPLIEEMGEDRFMETGKKLCEERGIAV